MTMNCNVQPTAPQISPAISMRPVRDIPLAPMQPARPARYRPISAMLSPAPITPAWWGLTSKQVALDKVSLLRHLRVLPPRLPHSLSNRFPAPSPPAWSSKMPAARFPAVPSAVPPRSETCRHPSMASSGPVSPAPVISSRAPPYRCRPIPATPSPVRTTPRGGIQSDRERREAEPDVYAGWSAAFWRRLPHGHRHGRRGG